MNPGLFYFKPVIFKTAYLYVCQISSVLIPTITLSSSSVCFPAAECWFQPLFLQTPETVTAAVGDTVGCICKVSFRFLSFFSQSSQSSTQKLLAAVPTTYKITSWKRCYDRLIKVVSCCHVRVTALCSGQMDSWFTMKMMDWIGLEVKLAKIKLHHYKLSIFLFPSPALYHLCLCVLIPTVSTSKTAGVRIILQ